MNVASILRKLDLGKGKSAEVESKANELLRRANNRFGVGGPGKAGLAKPAVCVELACAQVLELHRQTKAAGRRTPAQEVEFAMQQALKKKTTAARRPPARRTRGRRYRHRARSGGGALDQPQRARRGEVGRGPGARAAHPPG